MTASVPVVAPAETAEETGPGPLSLLAACLLPVFGAFAITGAAAGGAALAVEVLCLGWLVRDVPSVLRRLALGGVAAISIAVSTWLYGGRDADESLGAAARILYLVLPTALVSARILPSRLGDHLAQRLRLPPRVVVAATAALQRLEAIGALWRSVQRARRARGRGLDGGPVRRLRESGASAFALLVVAMRATSALAVAMDARGFAASHRRTWAESAPWTWQDWMMLGVAVGLAVLPWLLG